MRGKPIAGKIIFNVLTEGFDCLTFSVSCVTEEPIVDPRCDWQRAKELSQITLAVSDINGIQSGLFQFFSKLLGLVAVRLRQELSFVVAHRYDHSATCSCRRSLERSQQCDHIQ